LRKDKKKVTDALALLSHAELEAFEKSGEITVEGFLLTREDVALSREFQGDKNKYESAWTDEVLIVLDVETTEELELEGAMREIVNRVQRLRKAAKLQPGDAGVFVFYTIEGVPGPELEVVVKALRTHGAGIDNAAHCSLRPLPVGGPPGAKVAESSSKIGSVTFNLVLTRL